MSGRALDLNKTLQNIYCAYFLVFNGIFTWPNFDFNEISWFTLMCAQTFTLSKRTKLTMFWTVSLPSGFQEKKKTSRALCRIVFAFVRCQTVSNPLHQYVDITLFWSLWVTFNLLFFDFWYFLVKLYLSSLCHAHFFMHISKTLFHENNFLQNHSSYLNITMTWYSLVPNIESGSRQWSLLPILLPDFVFLGHRGINKLLLCKMLISFLSQRFRFCLRGS